MTGRRSTREATRKQLRLLDEIKRYIATRGFAPTVRELCDLIGVYSTSTVHNHLKALQKRGLIERNPLGPRTIRVVPQPPEPSSEAAGAA